VAALVEGSESTLKKYSQRKNEIILTPFNTAEYQPRTYSVDHIKVQSILISVIRKASGKEVGAADALEFKKRKNHLGANQVPPSN
jgi:hypothetical protein